VGNIPGSRLCARCRARRAVGVAGAVAIAAAGVFTGWPAGAGADAQPAFTERLVVDAADPAGTTTANQLAAGATYQVTARGTYQAGGGQSADAECATYPPDPTYRRSRLGVVQTGGPDDPYDLYLDGHQVDWVAVSPDIVGCDSGTHTYRVRFVPGRTGVLALRVAAPPGATGGLLVEITGPAVTPPTTTTELATTTTSGPAPAPPATTRPPAPPTTVAATPRQSARRDPGPEPPPATAAPPPSRPTGGSALPPELLEPPPVVSYPTSTVPARPAGGYALYPVASPDPGWRQVVPVGIALVLLGALASTAHATVRRRALAGDVALPRPPRVGGRTAHRSPPADRPGPPGTPGRTLRPDALTSRIGADGTCTCPSCGRRRRRRRGPS
jgi:hypothetical protein